MNVFDELFDNKSSRNELINGIVIGIVKEIYDEKFPGMIKAEILMTDGTINVTDWIRVIMPYAGKNRGMYMLPEIGDEIAIAFERGNIEKPYVIGSLWNGIDTIPEETVTEQNVVKKFKTKGGHEVVFDDSEDKGKIQITTAKESSITFEDEKNTIAIKSKSDDGEDTIILDSKNGNVSVNARKKITLDVSGTKIEIDGDGKTISIDSDNINLKGSNIKIKGNSVSIEGSQMDIKASGTLNIKSDSVANIKGSMVKIN